MSDRFFIYLFGRASRDPLRVQMLRLHTGAPLGQRHRQVVRLFRRDAVRFLQRGVRVFGIRVSGGYRCVYGYTFGARIRNAPARTSGSLFGGGVEFWSKKSRSAAITTLIRYNRLWLRLVKAGIRLSLVPLQTSFHTNSKWCIAAKRFQFYAD